MNSSLSINHSDKIIFDLDDSIQFKPSYTISFEFKIQLIDQNDRSTIRFIITKIL